MIFLRRFYNFLGKLIIIKSAISNRSFLFCSIFFDNYGKIYAVIQVKNFILLIREYLKFIIFDHTDFIVYVTIW